MQTIGELDESSGVTKFIKPDYDAGRGDIICWEGAPP